MSDEKPSGKIKIHGREYETVASRIIRFRNAHPNWSIVTTIIDRNEDMVLVRAEIANEHNWVLASGHAEEWRKASQINRTSAIENAETSAIGRALASLGFGGTEFASADELVSALNRQKSVGDPATHIPSELKIAAFDALPPEAQAITREWALEVIAYFENNELTAAAEFVIDMCGTDQDSLLALSSQLPANIANKVKQEMFVVRRRRKDADRANNAKEAA